MMSSEVEPQAFSKWVAVMSSVTLEADSVATAQSFPVPPSMISPAR